MYGNLWLSRHQTHNEECQGRLATCLPLPRPRSLPRLFRRRSTQSRSTDQGIEMDAKAKIAADADEAFGEKTANEFDRMVEMAEAALVDATKAPKAVAPATKATKLRIAQQEHQEAHGHVVCRCICCNIGVQGGYCNRMRNICGTREARKDWSQASRVSYRGKRGVKSRCKEAEEARRGER
jgi:hypothetical protein